MPKRRRMRDLNCSVVGCGKRYFSSSYCKRHYAQFYRTGQVWQETREATDHSERIEVEVEWEARIRTAEEEIKRQRAYYDRTSGLTMRMHRAYRLRKMNEDLVLLKKDYAKEMAQEAKKKPGKSSPGSNSAAQ